MSLNWGDMPWKLYVNQKHKVKLEKEFPNSEARL